MARSRKPVSCLRANAETGSKANSVSDSAAYLGGIGVTKRIALPELPVNKLRRGAGRNEFPRFATKLFPCAAPIPVASIMTASYSRRTDAFTTSLHSGWNNGQWRSTRHTSRFCRGEVRAAATVHCGAEIHEGSGHPDHSRRETGSRRKSSTIDAGKQSRRRPADGRHLSFLLHWNAVARRRAVVRHGSAGERNGCAGL